MGDVGSVPLGFVAGSLGLIGWNDGVWPIWFPILVFAPFVCDATLTLIRRLVRRERVWQAHRDHYYQRLVRMGFGHRGTAAIEYAVMLGCAVIALLARDATVPLQIVALVGATAALVAIAVWVDIRWARFEPAARSPNVNPRHQFIARVLLAFVHDDPRSGGGVDCGLLAALQSRRAPYLFRADARPPAVGDGDQCGGVPLLRPVPRAVALREPARPAAHPARGGGRGARGARGVQLLPRGLSRAALGVPDRAGAAGRRNERQPAAVPRLEGRAAARPGAPSRGRAGAGARRGQRRRGAAARPGEQRAVARGRAARRQRPPARCGDPGREGGRAARVGGRGGAALRRDARRDRDARREPRGEEARGGPVRRGRTLGDDGARLRGHRRRQGERLGAAQRRARRPARARSGDAGRRRTARRCSRASACS